MRASPSRAARPVVGILLRYLGRLRFPQLFVVTSLLFVVDLLLPDAVPFADEILLGLLSLLLGSWRRRAGPT